LCCGPRISIQRDDLVDSGCSLVVTKPAYGPLTETYCNQRNSGEGIGEDEIGFAGRAMWIWWRSGVARPGCFKKSPSSANATSKLCADVRPFLGVAAKCFVRYNEGMDEKGPNTVTIVGLGEALFDLLPTGSVLGGAPLNVAWHAHALLSVGAGQGIVASRVGSDGLGEEIFAQLARRGMATDYLQLDAQHPTGTVNVTLQAGQPAFEIVRNVAWDHMEFTPSWSELANRATAVCFGSLAQRSTASRGAIEAFLDAATNAIRLFDVNLRQHYYDRSLIEESCRRATMVKLNEAELPVMAKLLGLATNSPVEQLKQLQSRFGLDAVVYTRAERGTMLVLHDEVIAPPAVSYPAAPNADAVGAGDACSAGILVGWSLGLSPAHTAELANQLGAFVASQPGATPVLPPEIISLAERA
jgi:fructokinase